MENLNFDDEPGLDSDIEEEDSTPVKLQKRMSSSLNELKLDHENVTLHPIYILSQAFAKVSDVGSATALVAIRNQKEISIANLGDSGFLLIRFRNGEAYTAARSKEQ